MQSFSNNIIKIKISKLFISKYLLNYTSQSYMSQFDYVNYIKNFGYIRGKLLFSLRNNRCENWKTI